MNQEYEKVPSIISNKDLDYLSDMFTWNYGAYKSAVNASNSVNDEDIRVILNEGANVFHNTMNSILDILRESGNNE